MTDWHIFKGNKEVNKDWKLPDPPSWRPFGKEINLGESRRQKRADTFQARSEEIDMVNAAIYLRRPLLITGKPGTGKSSLAYAVAKELNLGEVLYWSITTRTNLKDGLYNYDAIARLQRLQEVKQREGQLTEEQKKELETRSIENYITLGALGTALLPSDKPRVLLIDEIDKSDIDLPNDLLTIFEEGRFLIPELVRLKKEVKTANVRTAYREDKTEEINDGEVICREFPLIFLTSNGERDFPAPFLRRCLRLNMKEPDKTQLVKIIKAHLEELEIEEVENEPNELKLKDNKLDELVSDFMKARETKTLANDQLLKALFMVTKGNVGTKDKLITQIMQDLGQVTEDESD
jgi:MoxR-like ATPase